METIYLCGPTVYDKAHIGNMRPILSFDIYLRALKYLKKSINFIHNITDIDDKIIEKAHKENVAENIISEKYRQHYLYLLKLFNIQMPTAMPQVTTNIQQIIDFIAKLVAQKSAYVKNNNVWFDVTKIKNYGSISHQDLDKLHYEANHEKNHPADFAVWKNTTHGMTFNSPWGQGRPGWHTECAAIINQATQGQPLQLHGGGIDLIFPHHENENAQFMALNKTNITKTWLHFGHLSVSGHKMSKSLNNMIDSAEFSNLYGVDTLRMILLMTNPTSPIDINHQIIKNAQRLVDKFKKAFLQAQLHITKDDKNDLIKQVAVKISKWQFGAVMKDIFAQIKLFHQTFNHASEIIAIMKLLGFNFSLLQVSAEDKQLYINWESLRKQKQFVKADELRKILQAKTLI